MMNNQGRQRMNSRRISFDIPATNDPKKVIEVCVRYSSEGKEKGFWIGITPIEFDGPFRVFRCYSGAKAFYEPAKRFSQKRLNEIMAIIKDSIIKDGIMAEDNDNRWTEIIRSIADSNGLQIANNLQPQ